MTDRKDGPPPYTPPQIQIAEIHLPSARNCSQVPRRRGIRRSRAIKVFALACLSFIVLAQWKQVWRAHDRSARLSIEKLNENLATCKTLRHKPQDPTTLGRKKNARYTGTSPTLIKNATIWIGEPVEGTSEEDARAGKGWEWTTGDVYLQDGLIQKMESPIPQHSLPNDTEVFDAKGRPLTAGIIDMHSHAGILPLPLVRGTNDVNEISDNITPYARSIDAIHVFDPQIQVSKSGGVTTALILPGSSNNIAGEAYLVKLAVGKSDGRAEVSVHDMLADPDRHWRYMKMACGENPKEYTGVGRSATRMGESFSFRQAFEQARRLVQKQDDWCDEASAVGVENMDEYLPQEVRWEALGAVMRGQVHVNAHCYTVPDLESMVSHTNEFQFAVRTFHHAHQTYLVPEILNRTWGGRLPASAIFADSMYYKSEAYIGSELAGKYLYEEGLTPIYVSDHPIHSGQHVVFEAAKGYHYGLPYHAAMASVTSAPAEELGMGGRLGKIKPGYDADVVVWDSDPLSVGATPVQIWIDGTAQYASPFCHDKPIDEYPSALDTALSSMVSTVTEPTQVADIVFKGIARVLLSDGLGYGNDSKQVNVVISNGKISCLGSCQSEVEAAIAHDVRVVELKNGYITPSITAVAGTVGLNEIDVEESTDNGANAMGITRAIDGLLLGSKKLHAGAQYGVTRAISAPKYTGPRTHHGISVGFVTTAQTSIERGAVFASDVAIHYTLDINVRLISRSYTEAFGTLRQKLLYAVASNATAAPAPAPFSEEAYLSMVIAGDLVLALTIHSADGIAAALRIKSDIDGLLGGTKIRMAIIGGAESHLLAHELAAASVGVILTPLQPMPAFWDSRRALSGAPLTNGTAADWLVEAGVTVAIGLPEDWYIRVLGFEAGIAYRNGGGRFTEKSAFDLISSNIYKILGVDVSEEDNQGHFIVSEGSPLGIGSRIKAVGSGKGRVAIYI